MSTILFVETCEVSEDMPSSRLILIKTSQVFEAARQRQI